MLANRLIILALATYKILQYKYDILIYGRLGTTIEVASLMSGMQKTLSLSLALLVLKFVLHFNNFSLKAFSARLNVHMSSGRTITYMQIAYSYNIYEHQWHIVIYIPFVHTKLNEFDLFRSIHVYFVYDNSVIHLKSL